MLLSAWLEVWNYWVTPEPCKQLFSVFNHDLACTTTMPFRVLGCIEMLQTTFNKSFCNVAHWIVVFAMQEKCTAE